MTCTLPRLTPECPFYRVENGFPTCSNECIDLVNSWEGERRPVGEARIGGLVLTGRKIPLSAAGPAHPYDATRIYLEQRSRPVADQATGSLIVGLGAALNQVPWWESGNDQLLQVNSLWAELERRNVPVESVIRAAIIPQVATQIGILSVMPLLRDDQLFDELASDEELARVDERAHSWSEVLQQSFDRDGGAAGVRTQISLWLDGGQTTRNLRDIFRLDPINFSDFDKKAAAPTDELLADMRLPYAMSSQFTQRVVQWLNRLLTDDLPGVVSWQAPPPAVFMALPATPFTDETGLWIWDRFAHTNLEDWATSSLLREWGGSEDDEGGLDQRVLLERAFDGDDLAKAALTRLAKPTRPRPAPKLSAQAFVNAAIRHLEGGENAEAAHIFEGLVRLRPTDGDSLNNLGFCLLPINPADALAVLQRSSLFPLDQQVINAANRVLALLLVGRAQEALQLARESEKIPVGPKEAGFCYSWTISAEPNQLRLQFLSSPRQYLSELIDYLETANA